MRNFHSILRGFMSVQSRQALRLIKFVSEMKKNHFPNASSFSELKPGRESEDELCVCCTYGIGSVDVAVAHKIYQNALEKGIGQKLMLWDNPLWV